MEICEGALRSRQRRNAKESTGGVAGSASRVQASAAHSAGLASKWVIDHSVTGQTSASLKLLHASAKTWLWR